MTESCEVLAAVCTAPPEMISGAPPLDGEEVPPSTLAAALVEFDKQRIENRDSARYVPLFNFLKVRVGGKDGGLVICSSRFDVIVVVVLVVRSCVTLVVNSSKQFHHGGAYAQFALCDGFLFTFSLCFVVLAGHCRDRTTRRLTWRRFGCSTR